jgi:hypothetical protein
MLTGAMRVLANIEPNLWRRGRGASEGIKSTAWQLQRTTRMYMPKIKPWCRWRRGTQVGTPEKEGIEQYPDQTEMSPSGSRATRMAGVRLAKQMVDPEWATVRGDLENHGRGSPWDYGWDAHQEELQARGRVKGKLRVLREEMKNGWQRRKQWTRSQPDPWKLWHRSRHL